MAFISTLLWLSSGLTAAASADPGCNIALVWAAEKYWGVSSLQGVAQKVLEGYQHDCAAGKCATVDIQKGCTNQSIDNITCDMEIFNESMQLGTNEICYGADWILCKAGCLGFSACVKACEHAIVDPCLDELTLRMRTNLLQLQNGTSSMTVSALEVNCSGDGIVDALSFNASSKVHISNASFLLKAQTTDAGISSTNNVDLHEVSMDVEVPFSGYVDCGVFTHYMNMSFGTPTTTNIAMDVGLQFDDFINDIAGVVCAHLSFCKDAIKDEITSFVKSQLVENMPAVVASQLHPVLARVASQLKCPSIILGNATNGSLKGLFV